MVEEMKGKTQKQVRFGVTWDNNKKVKKIFYSKKSLN